MFYLGAYQGKSCYHSAMSKVDIEKLAELARIDVPEDKRAELEEDIEKILEYVEQIQDVAAELPDTPEASEHHNVLRDDINPHEPGKYSEEILKEVPERKGDYVKVKQIL